jgi:uncharacterized membrane protein
MKKNTRITVIITSIVLLFYYAFTSGVVYELMQSNVTDRFDIPYSTGFSAERTGVAGVFNDDDVKCARWIVTNWDDKTRVIADYNGARLMLSEFGARREDIYCMQQRAGGPELLCKNSQEGFYILKTTWNAVNNKYVVGPNIGMRALVEWPSCDYPVVFQSGKSIVYRTF